MYVYTYVYISIQINMCIYINVCICTYTHSRSQQCSSQPALQCAGRLKRSQSCASSAPKKGHEVDAPLKHLASWPLKPCECRPEILQTATLCGSGAIFTWPTPPAR